MKKRALKLVTPNDDSIVSVEEILTRVRGERDLLAWFLLEPVAEQMRLEQRYLQVVVDFMERLMPEIEATNKLLEQLNNERTLQGGGKDV